MSLCVIFNPAARGNKARHLQRHLEAASGDWALKPTTGPGAARFLARAAVAEGFETIVAAGGDGTINEVLNGLTDAPEGLLRARLAILPFGTVNVFAREMGIPRSLAEAWAIATNGREIAIDLPCAEFRHGGAVETRYFLQLAGAGVDARVVERTSWTLKKRLGAGAYVIAAAQVLGERKPAITLSDGVMKTTGEAVVVGNGRFYGGSFPVFYRADYTDGWLDARVWPSMNWGTLPKHLWDWLSGRLYRPGPQPYLRGPDFTLTAERRVPFQLDGELVGELPVRLFVRPRALRVRVPHGTSA